MRPSGAVRLDSTGSGDHGAAVQSATLASSTYLAACRQLSRGELQGHQDHDVLQHESSVPTAEPPASLAEDVLHQPAYQ